MTRVFNPRPYQELIINHIVNTPRCAVWAEMGTGKTSSTLMALKFLNVLGESPALIIAPLRVAKTTWVDEISKWEQFSDLKCSVICGTPEQRLKALQTKADIYTINYENIQWLVNTMRDLKMKWTFKIIVADESTKLKSFRKGGKAVRARSLAQVAFLSDRFIELTGTPSPNGLRDLWGQIYFLDQGKRLGDTIGRFHSRWFYGRPIGPYGMKYEPADYAQAEIQEALKDLCITIKAEDWFDIEKPIETVIEVDLPPKARKMYTEMEKQMFTQLQTELEETKTIEAVTAATRTIKCLQVASGSVYDDDKEVHVIHDSKLKALESIVEEAAGKPVLVAYHWKHDLERLKKLFPLGRHLDSNPATIRAWNEGKIPVMFLHPQSAGHGLNLQDGGNILVMLSPWWDLRQYQQVVERIGPTRQLQAGHPRPVYVYHIVAKDTLDTAVIERRWTKATVQELLLRAMKKERRK